MYHIFFQYGIVEVCNQEEQGSGRIWKGREIELAKKIRKGR